MDLIEVTDISPLKFVTPSSRYSSSTVLMFKDRGVLTLETYKRKPLQVSVDDKYMIVPAGDEYRPDKTSFRVYGTVDFWWAILETNQIVDIFDYKTGLNIRIPSFMTIFNNG